MMSDEESEEREKPGKLQRGAPDTEVADLEQIEMKDIQSKPSEDSA